MDCREFQSRLADYLKGSLDAGVFDRMARHEAECGHCRRLAAEQMPDAAPPSAGGSGTALTAEILRRTLGADCRQIELSLAAEIDGPLPAVEAERVRQHLSECADCRALAIAMRLLPEAYGALPHLHAGAAFTRAVLVRTLPARPGFVSVLRRMWEGTGLVWEGALVCSLLLTPILNGPARESASRLGAELHQARLGLDAAVSPAERWRAIRTDLANVENRTEDWILNLSGWMDRQLELVWNGRASAPAPNRPRPAANAGEPDEGGNDELRQP